MLRFAVVGAGLLSIAGMSVASAADLPARTYTKAPPVVAAMYDWSGFYVGLNAGGAGSRGCWNLITLAGIAIVGSPSEGCNTATGALAGGQIGYRWQSTSWVFGIEAQGDWANLKGSNLTQVFPSLYSNFSNVHAIGLFTGQIGYAWNNALLYVKGGAALTSNSYSSVTTPGNLLFDSASDTRWGGAVGAGVEYGFAANWSVAVEYDHLFMGRPTVFFPTNAVLLFTRTDTISQDVDIGTVRLNYHFGGPVVAKY